MKDLDYKVVAGVEDFSFMWKTNFHSIKGKKNIPERSIGKVNQIDQLLRSSPSYRMVLVLTSEGGEKCNGGRRRPTLLY